MALNFLDHLASSVMTIGQVLGDPVLAKRNLRYLVTESSSDQVGPIARRDRS